MKNTNKAFTLVELIVVITILAILGTIAFISLQGYSQDAKNSKIVSDVRTIVTAIETKLTEGKILMGKVSTASLNNVNNVTGTFASGTTLTGSINYNVWLINFTALKQNGNDFKDNNGNDYIAATAIDGTDNAFYQVAGQITKADGTFEAVVKGNYVKIGTLDVDGLISASGSTNTTGIVNGTITSLYK